DALAGVGDVVERAGVERDALGRADAARHVDRRAVAVVVHRQRGARVDDEARRGQGGAGGGQGQGAAVHDRVAGVGVGGGQVQGAGADLGQVGAADDAGQVQRHARVDADGGARVEDDVALPGGGVADRHEGAGEVGAGEAGAVEDEGVGVEDAVGRDGL